MPFIVVTPSTVLPVSVEEVKLQTVVEHSEDDTLLEMYIKAAVDYGEKVTGRNFTPVTYQLELDSFPAGKIALRPNLQSVTSIVFTDSDGVEQTLDSNEYNVRTTAIVGYVEPVDSWPAGKDVVVTFTAGYPLSGGEPTTPYGIKLWLMVKVADHYKQRESFLAQGGNATVAPLPQSFIDNMLSCEIVPGVGAI